MYNTIDKLAEVFDDLPYEVQEDLREWFNVRKLDEED